MIWNSVLQNMSANKREGRRLLPAIAVVWAMCAALLLGGCSRQSGDGSLRQQSGGLNGQQAERGDGQQDGQGRDNVKGQMADGENLRVVTTIFPPYDFVREIAGDRVELKMLLKPGEESHSYEPTPQDIIAIQESDVFIYTGGENDVWVEDILSSMPESDRLALRLMDCVDTVEEEHVEGMKESPGHTHDEDEHIEEEHGEGEHREEEHDEYGEDGYGESSEDGEDAEKAHSVHEIDEHVWTSPVNASLIVEEIKELLIKADPEGKTAYEENAKAYQAELSELDEQLREVTVNAERNLLIFGDRFPFRYLADEYGLDYYAAFPGCAGDTEPSAATMVFLIDKAKEEHVPYVLKMELSNADIANAVAEAAGTGVKVLYSCHNLSADDFENGETYLSMMQKNVETLKEVLNGWR